VSAASQPSLAEVCVVACAEAWRGDGEILASPIGTIPTVGARLAALTFEPDLVYTDGDALQLAAPIAAGAAADVPKSVEAWMPFGRMFDIVWSGRRHVMMGATQVDRYGNQNIACIGPWAKPKAQLLGVRGAPGNTVNNPTSYWVPQHSTRVFVESVDCVSGVGYDRAAAAGPSATRFHEIRVVVSNKAVLDFDTPDHAMRIRSVHPGVTVDDVVENTGFPLVVPDDVPVTRAPTDEDLLLIRDLLDPANLRNAEVPE
jgi:acyl CoA:acetate/3-ketoacid CoA transferase beta subunit